jgi:hypothetical protein
LIIAEYCVEMEAALTINWQRDLWTVWWGRSGYRSPLKTEVVKAKTSGRHPLAKSEEEKNEGGRRLWSPWTIFLRSAAELLHDVVLQEDLEAGMITYLIIILLNVRVQPQLIFMLKMSEHLTDVFVNFGFVEQSFRVSN